MPLTLPPLSARLSPLGMARALLAPDVRRISDTLGIPPPPRSRGYGIHTSLLALERSRNLPSPPVCGGRGRGPIAAAVGRVRWMAPQRRTGTPPPHPDPLHPRGAREKSAALIRRACEGIGRAPSHLAPLAGRGRNLRVCARIPGEGQRRVLRPRNLVQPANGPSPQPSPRKRGEGEICASDPACARFLHELFRVGDIRHLARGDRS
jgi:hypothetical protein